MKTNKIITAVKGSFYFYGEEGQSDDTFFKMKNAYMFRSFGGEKGLPAVHRGDPSAKVTLDYCGENGFVKIPHSSLFAIMENCAELEKFAGATIPKNKQDMPQEISNRICTAVEGGFYFFGEQIQAPVGYIGITNAAMSGGFDNMGFFGVVRGDSGARMRLDRFEKKSEIFQPLSSVCAIFENCVDLYNWKNVELR
jgi:hypothetical protein